MSWRQESKQAVREAWNASASQYRVVRSNLDKWTPYLLERASPSPGEHVLDVACGDGEPALAFARAVGPNGRVVGVDIADRMVEASRERAKTEGVGNAEFEVMDAEALPLPDESFDVVTCRFALHLVPDPDAAVEQMHRVLRPGGRLAVAVWGPGERCPALDAIVAPVAEQGDAADAPDISTPYAMAGPGELAEILVDAGFRNVGEARFTHDWEFPSADAYIDAIVRGTPMGRSLHCAKALDQVIAKARANIARYTQPDGRVIAPAEAVVVWARKG